MPNRLPTRNVVQAYLSGQPAEEVAERFGASRQGVRKLLQREGIPLRDGRRRGPKHPNWRGGVRENSRTGYVRVWVDPDDPMAVMVPASEKGSHVPQHRLVMARLLGRPLFAWEQVHHINGIRNDNRIENLQLVQGAHGNGVVLCCGDCGSSNVVPQEIQSDNPRR